MKVQEWLYTLRAQNWTINECLYTDNDDNNELEVRADSLVTLNILLEESDWEIDGSHYVIALLCPSPAWTIHSVQES